MSNHPEYFGDNWCPLTGELPDKESLSGKDKRIFDCIEIIESARNIWNPDSHGNYPEWKLNSAQMLWKLFRNLDRPFLITDLYDVIPWSKIYSNSEIDKQITESEIKAIFLIYTAYTAIYSCNKGAQRDVTTLIDNIEKELNLIWKNIKEVEQSEKSLENKVRKQKITQFNTPAGAKWNDLEMIIIGYEKVKLKVKSETITTNYKEMGFEDKRKGEPNDAWKRLTVFAWGKGMLMDFSSTEKGKIEKDVQEIRNTLSEYFKINGKPIPDYKKEEGYKTAFKISYHDEQEQKSKELSNFDDNKDDINF